MDEIRAAWSPPAFVPPAAALSGLGALLGALAVWNFAGELEALSLRPGPVVAFLITFLPALAVVYAGYRLSRSSLSRSGRWTVTVASYAGFGVAVAMQALTVAVRIAEGRVVSEPLFPLLVVGGVGTLAGTVTGHLLVRVRETAAEATTARDAMAFTNGVLRHDVRNGLQVLLGQSDVVRSLGSERAERAADRITEQVESLLDLTDHVGAVSRVLADRDDPRPLDLAALLRDEVATAEDAFPAAAFDTALEDPLTVRGTDALAPVFSNLLSNAVHHTAPDARVRVAAETDGDVVRVTVADDGPGIPPDRREEIFERGVTDGRGDGLGLYIVRTIVEHSDGHVRVAESDLGGAAFVVELPAADQHVAEPVLA